MWWTDYRKIADLFTDFHVSLKSIGVDEWIEVFVRFHLFLQTLIVQDQISFKNLHETKLLIYEKINKGDHAVSA